MLTVIQGNSADPRTVEGAGHGWADVAFDSPPYWRQRDHGDPDQIGMERNLDCLAWARGEPPCDECYICSMRKVGRVHEISLSPYGVWFIVIDDTRLNGRNALVCDRVRLALEADGWRITRAMWLKPNARPEPAARRPAHVTEDIIIATREKDYYWDRFAIMEEAQPTVNKRGNSVPWTGSPTRMGRDVIVANVAGNKGKHDSTFPVELPLWGMRAALSQRGYCPTCNRPFVRVVVKDVYDSPDNPNPALPYGAEWHNNGGDGSTLHKVTRWETVGWRPTCDCYDTVEWPLPGAPWLMNTVVEREELALVRPVLSEYDKLLARSGRVVDFFGGTGQTARAAWEVDPTAHVTIVELRQEAIEELYENLNLARVADFVNGVGVFDGGDYTYLFDNPSYNKE